MDSLKRTWKRIPTPIRKPLVLMVGAAIVVAGLAMLVLPGPGWAAIFLGFAVLATEFAVAEKVRDWLVVQLKRLLRKGKSIWNGMRGKTPPQSSDTSKKTPPNKPQA
jgi:uncharacterized protein (TIGR02611 family)